MFVIGLYIINCNFGEDKTFGEDKSSKSFKFCNDLSLLYISDATKPADQTQ